MVKREKRAERFGIEVPDVTISEEDIENLYKRLLFMFFHKCDLMEEIQILFISYTTKIYTTFIKL